MEDVSGPQRKTTMAMSKIKMSTLSWLTRLLHFKINKDLKIRKYEQNRHEFCSILINHFLNLSFAASAAKFSCASISPFSTAPFNVVSALICRIDLNRILAHRKFKHTTAILNLQADFPIFTNKPYLTHTLVQFHLFWFACVLVPNSASPRYC